MLKTFPTAIAVVTRSTSGRVWHRLRIVLQVCTVLLAAAFWWGFAVNRDVRSRFVETLQYSRRPLLLNGMTLELDRQVAPALRRAGPSGRYLLLVSGDTCRSSRLVVDSWRDMLSTVPFGKDDVVLLLSLSGTDIPAALQPTLQRRGISHQILSVRDRAQFAEHTSLAWSPAIVTLDSNLRIRLVAARFTAPVASEVTRFFERRANPAD